jgi:hypothetical protein
MWLGSSLPCFDGPEPDDYCYTKHKAQPTTMAPGITYTLVKRFISHRR